MNLSSKMTSLCMNLSVTCQITILCTNLTVTHNPSSKKTSTRMTSPAFVWTYQQKWSYPSKIQESLSCHLRAFPNTNLTFYQSSKNVTLNVTINHYTCTKCTLTLLSRTVKHHVDSVTIYNRFMRCDVLSDDSIFATYLYHLPSFH